MNERILLSQYAFNTLLRDLVELEEKREDIFLEYVYSNSAEGAEIRELIDHYIQGINSLLTKITIAETAANDFPMAVIGSKVTIQDTGSQACYDYRIILPCKEAIQFGDVSILSPMGKALLFKSIDECFTLRAPGGEFIYKVLAIKM